MISGSTWRPGSRTSIMQDRKRALGREYLPRYVRPHRRALTRIVFLQDIRFEALPFSADSTMEYWLEESAA